MTKTKTASRNVAFMAARMSKSALESQYEAIIIKPLDVAVTGLDSQSRPTEDLPNCHLQVRYDQKVAKCGHIAEQNGFQFIPAIFSHTGQIHAETLTNN